MAAYEERETRGRVSDVPSTVLGWEEKEYEEDLVAGGVSGLVNRCEGLTLAGGVEGGGFRIRAVEGKKDGGVAGGSASAPIGGQGLQGNSALNQGYGWCPSVREGWVVMVAGGRGGEGGWCGEVIVVGGDIEDGCWIRNGLVGVGAVVFVMEAKDKGGGRELDEVLGKNFKEDGCWSWLETDGVGGVGGERNCGCWWIGRGSAIRVKLMIWGGIGDVGWKNMRRVRRGMMMAGGGGEGSGGPPGPIG